MLGSVLAIIFHICSWPQVTSISGMKADLMQLKATKGQTNTTKQACIFPKKSATSLDRPSNLKPPTNNHHPTHLCDKHSSARCRHAIYTTSHLRTFTNCYSKWASSGMVCTQLHCATSTRKSCTTMQLEHRCWSRPWRGQQENCPKSYLVIPSIVQEQTKCQFSHASQTAKTLRASQHPHPKALSHCHHHRHHISCSSHHLQHKQHGYLA